METPQLPPPEEFRFHAVRRTRWSDEDNQHVLNNAVYLSLLEEARFEYFTALDLVEDNQFPFVLAQANVRFVSPGRGGQLVRISLRTTHLGTTSFRQAYRLESEEGVLLGEAECLLVAWSNEARSKAPMSERFRARIAGFEGLQ